MKYDWLKEIDYKSIFPEEYKELIEILGIELFGKIFDAFRKTPIYFSEEPIKKAQKLYILEYANNNPDLTPRELARKIGASERFVYKVLRETEKPEQPGLF